MRVNGFTLLEVLVALAVLTFALAALWQALNQGRVVSSALPERVQARWVAHNRIVLHQAGGLWPEPQVNQGRAELGRSVWYWEEQISNTNEPELRRITVKVGAAPEALTLTTQDGFIRRPE